jgi:hypothetical protein
MTALLKQVSPGKSFRSPVCVICVVLSCLILSCASAPMAAEVDMSFAGGVQSRSYETGAERMIAYSADIEIEVKKLNDAKTAVIEEIGSVEGFIIQDSTNYVTARVPEESLDLFLQRVRLLGKVNSENKTGKDISDQYRDDLIRLESLKNVRGRYTELLEKAVTVTELLEIEKEMERVNAEIEILEGRKRYAELSVRYSAVTVRLQERTLPGPLGWIFFGLYSGLKWLFVW